MNATKNLNLRDLCLLWGCPGVVFLTISMFAALKVSADFQQDSLVKWMTFLLCSIFLWLLYIMFQSTLADLLPQSWDKQPLLLPYIIEEEKPVETESISSNANVESESPSVQYTQRCKEYELEQEQKRQETIAAIMDYTRHTMSPFVYDDEEMDKLCHEIQNWAEEYTYTPAPIRLKQKLTTVDLRHFVWNIGERLGNKNNYSGYVRAGFIKSMFPNTFMDMNLDSIRNFKFQPDKGSIVIDEPDKDDWHFHYR